MYRIVDGNPRGLADVSRFIDLINKTPAELRGLFDGSKDIYIARAPGRLDVMGGVADYSGSLVLEMPIAEATLAAAQVSGDQKIEIVSRSSENGKVFSFEMDVSELEITHDPTCYQTIRSNLSRDRSKRWAAYAAGVFFVLKKELGFDFGTGTRILVTSMIPIGKGVSSSAALEVAVMQAVCAAYHIRIEPLKFALLCQKVENEIVGAPCGVMDQTTSHCGSENSLLSLRCQPAEILENIHIPDGVEFWGIDSGVRHAVAGSDYTSVRVGAFMGYRMIAEFAGLSWTKLENGRVVIDDDRWQGYLANVTPAEYEQRFSSLLPESIRGSEFIEKYSCTSDQVTTIDPETTYAVKAPAELPIYENARVSVYSDLIRSASSESHFDELGEMMFASHAGYAACGLTESGTDRIVELVRQYRPKGLFGARITGGGSGGTVAILARKGSLETITELARKYESETGRKPYIFHGSSPGCAAFGHLRLAASEQGSAMHR